ncbi:NIC1 protein [Gonium pectorale]|uniref:NIC1 protein n=1 Tax=Gonium pectorale TaxID=33097 RepID=A0A150GH48_GONPE|nr:NIC1 protein [Gonium pectorale]|eukprot:KXZ49156.1 NIC1 protein [Gonium pectorale]
MPWGVPFRSLIRRDRGGTLSAAAAAAAAAAATAWGSWGVASSAEGPSAATPSKDRYAAATAAAPASSSAASAASAAAAAADAGPRLPVHKLACRADVPPPRLPVVLVCCGSFNPPTVMHLRCVELAAEELRRRGHDVWGAYLSPVADAYGKKGLAPAADRVAMCRLATGEDPDSDAAPRCRSGSGQSWRRDPDPELDLAMVYDWEARQPGYTRTLAVLRRVEAELQDWLAGAGARETSAPLPEATGGAAATASTAAATTTMAMASTAPLPSPPSAPGAPSAAAVPHLGAQAAAGAGAVARLDTEPVPRPTAAAPRPRAQRPGAQQPGPVRAVLLCGADVLASMAVPGVWRDPEVILREHGVVCVAREGTDLEALLATPGSVLYDHRDRVVLVYDRVGNSISSSAVRGELAAGRPARHLVPPGVLSYIYGRGLYGARVARGAGSGASSAEGTGGA